jgi:hypothetical protein
MSNYPYHYIYDEVDWQDLEDELKRHVVKDPAPLQAKKAQDAEAGAGTSLPTLGTCCGGKCGGKP